MRLARLSPARLAASYLLFALCGPAAADGLPAMNTGINSTGNLADDGERGLWLELEGYKPLEPPAPSELSNDLLARVREGFTLESVRNKQVQAHLDWFVRHPEYLDRVFTRAQRYMPYIVAELEARDLPLELALLPIVESAYDPFAYSHGRASGLWQMIPGTAKRFGVRQNWWYDGRRDVVDSTSGALNYLEYLHDLLDGEWLLAIASYNSGEGNVLRSMRRNRSRSQPTDFWHLSLPRETRAYVPRLLALVELVRDPDAYGIELPKMLDEPQFAELDVGGQLDLALAAQLSGLDIDTLYAFNSGFNRWATDPDGPHRLILPVDASESFREALAAVPANERVRWKRHEVRPGETISGIATRYHTTIGSIREANGLRGNVIRAGAHLTIPVASKPLDAYSRSADARREKTQNRQRAGQRVEHSVRPGESFWSIGRRYGVGMRELASWNAMAPRDTLSVGQTLVVWTNASTAVAPDSGPVSKERTRRLHYTVRNGDSLYLIANRFRITVADLVRWNGIDRNAILRPGQKLTMYVDVTRQSG